MKNKLSTSFLIACALFFGINCGASLYQHIFGIPAMLQSPAVLAPGVEALGKQAPIFWVPNHLLMLVTLIVSLILNWKNPRRKALVLTAFIIYIYISAISGWFVKDLFALTKMADTPAYHEHAQRWLLLSWHRVVLTFVVEVLLLHAISRPVGKVQAA
jgi:hypothetical protein